MKSSRIVSGFLVLVLVISCTVQPVLASVTDVPRDHWAYQAVISLVNRGFLATYEDGSFQGTNPVDRYTLAVTVARILDEIEAGRVMGSQSDIDLLRDLSNEFRTELVQFYADKQLLEKNVDETQKLGLATEERVNKVVASQAELMETVARLKADIMEEASKTAEILKEQRSLIEQTQAAVNVQAESLQSQHEQIQTHQESISELQQAVIKVDEQLRLQQADLQRLQNWTAEKDAIFSMLVFDADFQSSLEELSTQLAQELETREQEQQGELQALQQKVDELLAAIARTDGELVRSYEQLKVQLENLNRRNQELEKDLQNIAVLLEQEKQNRTVQAQSYDSALTELRAEIERVAAQVGISEEELAALNKRISDEIAVQMNAAIIRERGLSTTVAELQAEFDTYKAAAEKEIKSAKSTAMIAIAAAAVSVLIGFIK
ncbi:MAG: hypothetical protein GX177_06505 [Firmicutes bacterium]|jgi:chromosome segregation ATPase|nr:hypothetical protein [Bacillota bacterium]